MCAWPAIEYTCTNPGKSALSKSASRARLAEIIRKRSFGRGEITLASGRKSDFYFNLKPTMLDPEGAALLAELSYEALKDDISIMSADWKWARCRSPAPSRNFPGSRAIRL